MSNVTAVLLAAVALTGCGRLGFDVWEGDAGAVDDDALPREIVAADGGRADGEVDLDASTDAFTDASADASTDATVDVSTDAPPIDGGFGGSDPIYLRYVSVQFSSGAPLTAAAGDIGGDVILRPLGGNRFDGIIRFASLRGGVPESEPDSIRGTFTFEEDGRVLLEPSDGNPTVVTSHDVTGARWTMRVDESDPRSAGGGQYARVSVLDRLPMPPDETVGDWRLVSFASLGTPALPAGSCGVFSGANVIVDVDVLVDPFWLIDLQETFTEYTDAGCTIVAGALSLNVRGFVIEEPGNTASAFLWDRSDGSGMTVRFGYERAGTMVTYRVLSCAPSGCESLLLDEMTFTATGL